MMNSYRFQLLRYLPNRLSEEFYNLAVLLYTPEGRLLDARFVPDFARLRCNPLADLPFLRQLKGEFEERRLTGEDFSAYLGDLLQNLSQALNLSEQKFFLGGEALPEMERLIHTYLVIPRRPGESNIEPAEGTRRWILGRMRETFERHHLLGRLQTDVPVGSYVSPRFSFRMDYASQPNGRVQYLHALSLRRDVDEAARLCFVFDRIRTQAHATLTAVTSDALAEDTQALLQSSQIRSWPVSRLDELARTL